MLCCMFFPEFKVLLSSDIIRTGDNHGILEIREQGLLGRICQHNFSDVEASVACRMLGFSGKFKIPLLDKSKL